MQWPVTITPVVADALINKSRSMFERANSLVDVSGATGTLARVVAEKFPHLECTVIDLPHLVSEVKGDSSRLERRRKEFRNTEMLQGSHHAKRKERNEEEWARHGFSSPLDSPTTRSLL